MSIVRSSLGHPTRIAAALPILLLAACSSASDPGLDPTMSLYAAVSGVDGTSFYPPLGPTPTPTGTFDASLLNRLRVVLESTSTDGDMITVAIFDSRSSPALTLLSNFEMYFINIHAATYFTDRAQAYRFRILLDGNEIGRSDMSGAVFDVLAVHPDLQIGFKTRIEARPVPSISAISPGSVPRNSAALTLTVTARRFATESVVRVDGHDYATRRGANDTLLVDLPASLLTAPHTYGITVFTPAPGGGTSNTANFVVFDPPPAISAVTPNAATAGTSAVLLTIDGSLFTDASSVRFDGAALSTTYSSAERLFAQLPASSILYAGSHTVTVVNPPNNGSAGMTFTISNPAPTIAALNPTSVIAGSNGFTLTVTGTEFSRQSTVRYDGANLTTYFISATQLSASVSADSILDPGTHQITVTSPAPGGGSTAALTFSVSSPVPSFVSMSPSSAVIGGANLTLTLDGTSFLSGAVASFAGTPLATTYVSRTRLLATLPASLQTAAGAASVIVANPEPYDATSGGLTFTLLNPTPTITSINPTGTTVGTPGFPLTIRGTSFVQDAVITFGGVPLATTFVSSTMLTTIVPGAILTTAGHPAVAVTNPAPSNGNASTSLTVFNPVPTITLTPTTVPVGTPGVTLTITGGPFYGWPYTILDTIELVDRQPVGSSQVIVRVPAARLATPGTWPFIMRNALPTPGYTTPIDFTVAEATCSDHIQNGDETGVDCGGSVCPVCFNQGCAEGDTSCTELSVALATNGGVASASDTQSGTTPARVNDGVSSSSASGWGNGGQGGSRLMARLARPYDVFGVSLYWGGNNGGWGQGTNGYLPRQMQVQYSNDPTALASDPANSSKWTALDATANLLASSPGTVTGAEIQPGFTNLGWNSLQSIRFNRVTATAIRLVFDGNPAANNGSSWVGLVGELDVLGAVLVDGSACTVGSACASGVCNNGLCDVASCTDGVKNGDETDADCGGSCGACPDGHLCLAGTDCRDLVCASYVCQAPTCTDGVKNGTETDTDCGSTCSGCATNRTCTVAADCASGICAGGLCAAPSCTDGLRNGLESDVDCGGNCALRCDVGQRCGSNIDCTTGLCSSGACRTPDAVLTSLSPASLVSGSADTILTLTGSAFMSDAVASLNGTALATTFVSATELRARVPAGMLITAGTFSISVNNPGTTAQSARTFTVNNPAPAIASFTPTAATAGDPTFTITIFGSNFVSGAGASLSGGALVTTFVSATELTAVIPGGAVAVGGYHDLVVTNPAPSLGASAARTFTVNNVPATITSLSPATTPERSAQLTLTINGSGFGSGAEVVFSGISAATTFVSTTRLTAVIPAAALTVAGTTGVTVQNPAPSAGASAPFSFTITAASCTDAVRNGGESDTDCGGTCNACANGRTCSIGHDCTSQVCSGGVCQAPVCTDGARNGTETDADCGGACPACATGRTCLTGADCQTASCTSGVCATPTCTDGVMNGTETGVDCGGTCGACVFQCSGSSCTSCLTILEAGGSHGSGLYMIDPDGAGPIAPFATYCDMTTDGGGWSLAAKLSASALSASNTTDPRTALFSGNLNVGDTTLMNRGNQLRHYSTPLMTTAWSIFKEARFEVVDNNVPAQVLTFDTTNVTPASAAFARSHLKSSTWTDLWEETANYFSIDGDTTNGRSFFVNRNYGGCPADAGWMVVKNGGSATCSWDGAAPYSIRYAHGTTYKNLNDTANYSNATALAVWVRERAPVTSRASCLEIYEAGLSTGDGVYNVDPSRDGNTIPVFCDMTTAGGGWTMVYKHSAGTAIPALSSDFITASYLGGNLNETNTALLNRTRSATDYSNRFINRFWGRFAEARVEVEAAGAPVKFLRYNLTGGSGPASFYAKSRLTDSSWNDLVSASQNYWAARGDEANRRYWFINNGYGGCPSDTGWLVVNNATGCSWESGHPNSIQYANAGTMQNWTSGQVGQGDALVVMVRERLPANAPVQPASCQAWLNSGFTQSGLYDIDPGRTGTSIRVYCDMTTDGGGWALAWKHSAGINRDPGVDLANGALNATDTTLMTRAIATSDFVSTIASTYRFPSFTQARFEVVVGGVVQHYTVHNAVGQTARSVMARSTLLRTDWADLLSTSQNYFSIDGDSARNVFINQSYAGCASDAGWLVALQGTGYGCGWETLNANQIMYANATSAQNWTTGRIARADAILMWLR